jgi:signal transduction histidine kinase
MLIFRSYRTKLQAAFVTLGLAAIGVTGREAWEGAREALRSATFDHLTSIRETRCRQIERYFEDLRSHVMALSASESTVAAVEDFRAAWSRLPPAAEKSIETKSLRALYRSEFGPRVAKETGGASLAERWFPSDPRTRMLQYHFIAANPHPVGSKDLLVTAPGVPAYSRAHVRHHPTLHRYQTSFGFYDIFLIDAATGRILYTVFKELDLGADLRAQPYQGTTLAKVFERVVAAAAADEPVIEDYAPYAASYFAPAAFLAAPVRRAGAMIGVLAIQVSVDEVNRVMTGDRKWKAEGLGDTGQAYIVGPDNTLRSDFRFELEQPERYFRQLEASGVGRDVIERIRRYNTAILNLPAGADVAASLKRRERATEMGADFRGTQVIRSIAPLKVPGLNWSLVAEIEAAEALAPARTLRSRIIGIGLLVAAAFFAAARFLAGSVTRPVRALASIASRLGVGDFGVRVPVTSSDEIGELAESFNRMAANLERTTVSKAELEVLARRLITAQEEERSRLARELHDDLSQRLAAVAIEAGKLEQIPIEEASRWRCGLERIKTQMAAVSTGVHSLSHRLHPATLRDLGLVAAMESESRGFFESGGPPVAIDAKGDFSGLGADVRLCLFRIVQEALTNIRRHASASQVNIHLEQSPGEVALSIHDDGQGFDRAAPSWRPRLGLASMEERVRLLDGRLEIDSSPGRGTRITVRLPVESAQ